MKLRATSQAGKVRVIVVSAAIRIHEQTVRFVADREMTSRAKRSPDSNGGYNCPIAITIEGFKLTSANLKKAGKAQSAQGDNTAELDQSASTDKATVAAEHQCHICTQGALQLVNDYGTLPRVTSDCSPWQSGGLLGICPTCGCVQNPTDQHWQSEVDQIYGKYSIYQQGAGNEQFVFAGGQPVARSARLMEMTSPYLNLTAKGRILDFGCANGGLLRNFARLNSNWTMVGFEVDDKHKSEIESIAKVESFSSGNVGTIAGKFDLITMSHVLEHLPQPAQTLGELSEKIADGGFLLIQVPDAAQNPFDLVIADHCSHFTLDGLKQLIVHCGYRIVVATTDWVPKEISILATPEVSAKSTGSKTWQSEPSLMAAHSIDWLARVAVELRSLRKVERLGIFGSSIAATWLLAALDGKVDFFVDEDPNRIGQKHLGKPIYSSDEIPPDSHVFIGLIPQKASQVGQRLSGKNVQVHLPPAL